MISNTKLSTSRLFMIFKNNYRLDNSCIIKAKQDFNRDKQLTKNKIRLLVHTINTSMNK